MASREDRERAARNNVAGRIFREMQRRGTPVSYNAAESRATRIAERDHNERRDSKPAPMREVKPASTVPEGIRVVNRALDERGRSRGRSK